MGFRLLSGVPDRRVLGYLAGCKTTEWVYLEGCTTSEWVYLEGCKTIRVGFISGVQDRRMFGLLRGV